MSGCEVGEHGQPKSGRDRVKAVRMSAFTFV